MIFSTSMVPLTSAMWQQEPRLTSSSSWQPLPPPNPNKTLTHLCSWCGNQVCSWEINCMTASKLFPHIHSKFIPICKWMERAPSTDIHLVSKGTFPLSIHPYLGLNVTNYKILPIHSPLRSFYVINHQK